MTKKVALIVVVVEHEHDAKDCHFSANYIRQVVDDYISKHRGKSKVLLVDTIEIEGRYKPTPSDLIYETAGRIGKIYE